MSEADSVRIVKALDEFVAVRKERMSKMYSEIMQDETKFVDYLADAMCVLELAFLYLYSDTLTNKSSGQFQPFVVPKND